MTQHGSLCIECFNDPMFAENGYLLWQEGRSEAWIVDPGLPPQPQEFVAAIDEMELTPAGILLTHGHADHIAGVRPLRQVYKNVPIWCPRDEAELLVSAQANLSAAMGFGITAPPADRLLDAGESIDLVGATWKTIDVRGHSPGGMAFYSEGYGIVISGDALFADSIGRYDFPHSSRRLLLDNIRNNLLTLPDETIVYSGHGPPESIGRIKKFNQVLRSELRG